MPPSNPPHHHGSRLVLARFGLRLIILAAFATAGAQGFVMALVGLLTLAALFCLVTAAIRHEAMVEPALCHWDEAAANILLDGMLLRFT
jgi:hypothetical protein